MTLGSDITWYDIWMPSTENVAPMVTDQVAMGYFRNFFNNKIELSTEVYYKYQNGVSDFEDGLHNYLVNNLEAYVAQGIGRSYGFEISVEKPKGDFTSRISYNLGESLWEIDAVNQGRPYHNMFDITHSLNSQFSYNASKVKRLKDFTFSLNFVYYTGRPVTLPENYYYIGNVAMPYWEARNQYRLPDYHRIDIGMNYEPESLSFKTKKNNRKFQPSLDISLYNIYNRRNIFTIDMVNNGSGKGGTDPSSVFSAQGRSTFGFVPSFQFNLKF
jgi:ACT domain-containing protein